MLGKGNSVHFNTKSVPVSRKVQMTSPSLAIEVSQVSDSEGALRKVDLQLPDDEVYQLVTSERKPFYSVNLEGLRNGRIDVRAQYTLQATAAIAGIKYVKFVRQYLFLRSNGYLT